MRGATRNAIVQYRTTAITPQRFLSAVIAIFGCAIAFGSIPSAAEMVKLAAVEDKGIHFYWWPKIVVPGAWHEDREMSLHYGMEALAPDKSTFVSAETVMYARAPYKPREKEWPTLDAMIEADKEGFAEHKIGIQTLDDLIDADGQHFQSYSFTPPDGSKENWEAVAYGQEDDFYLVFTISSRSKSGYKKNYSTFASMVKSYAKKLPSK